MERLYEVLGVRRVASIGLFALPIAFGGVLIVLILNPQMSADEIIGTVAIPLMVSYILVRGAIWVATDIPPMSPEEIASFERLQKNGRHWAFSAIGVVVFVGGMWIFATAGLSLVAYYLLGLHWAAQAALLTLRLIFWVVAISAVQLCLKWLCKIALVKIAHLSRIIFDLPFPHGQGQGHVG